MSVRFDWEPTDEKPIPAEGDVIDVYLPNEDTPRRVTVGPEWRYVGWVQPAIDSRVEQLKSDLFAALAEERPTWGFVTVGDHINPFRSLGYPMMDLDRGSTLPGYGWLTFIDREHASLIDDALLSACVADGLRVSKLGATHAFELPDGPVSDQHWYDRLDELLSPVRVERRGMSQGGHTDDTRRTLSSLDAALCIDGNAMVRAPARHPDWLSRDEDRDEMWPDEHHRPPLSWYGTDSS